MHSFNKDVGYLGEDIAFRYLKNLGYIILDRNFSCKIGEIDLIGKDKDYICFIEVKSRYGTIYGRPCESITYYKKRKIYKTAQMYILKKKLYGKFNFRFDVVEIILNHSNSNHSIRLIKNAFGL